MSATIEELREQLDMHRELLSATNDFLVHDPTDADTLQSKAETESDISRIEAEIAALEHKSIARPVNSTASKHAQSPPPPPPPATSNPQPTLNLSVGDHIQAKWSEDQQYYAAVVLSKTGNPSDPLYTVKFTGYGNTETKKSHEIKAADPSKKRKAEDSTPASSVPPPPPPPASTSSNNANVISAAPSVDTTAATAAAAKKRVPSMVSDGPTRLPREPKKLKSNKALDKAKSNWQAWQKTGPKVSGSMSAPKQKESQFRVGQLPGAKVGFTGSGKGITKDAARPVWKASGNDD